MKKIAFFIPFLLSTLLWATTSPEEYPIKVHVSASRWVVEPNGTIMGFPSGDTGSTGPGLFQRLNVTIDGKKYELRGDTDGGNPSKVSVLALGDYKAKLVRDVHTSEYEFSRTYEFLLPDNKTRKFIVVGQLE